MVDIVLVHIENEQVRNALFELSDPEIPSAFNYGYGNYKRSVEISMAKKSYVKLTPTYSGCPAMDTIATDIKIALDNMGFETDVELVLSPAWTTDWITERGRKC